MLNAKKREYGSLFGLFSKASSVMGYSLKYVELYHLVQWKYKQFPEHKKKKCEERCAIVLHISGNMIQWHSKN